MSTHHVSIRIVLAEDHVLMREGLRAILSSQASFHIVGEASDGLEAVQLVEKLRPDVLLLELRIPRLHGVEVLHQLREQHVTRIIVVSSYSEEPSLLEALQNGAAGFVLKDCPASELIEAIRRVAAGGEYFARTVQQKAMSARLKELVPGAQFGKISTRELAVLQLAAEGKSNAEVAKQLFISRRTVEAHRSNLMRKLQLGSQTELVLYAIRNRILTT